jgi:hypothetical protein
MWFLFSFNFVPFICGHRRTLRLTRFVVLSLLAGRRLISGQRLVLAAATFLCENTLSRPDDWKRAIFVVFLRTPFLAQLS